MNITLWGNNYLRNLIEYHAVDFAITENSFNSSSN